MGFFKNMIGKITGAEEKASQAKRKAVSFPLEFVTSEQDDWTRIISVNRENMEIKHNDGRKTNLLIASVNNGRGSEMVFAEDVDYIAFEIPQGTDISEALLQKVINGYLQDKVNRHNQECVYIGEVSENAENDFRKKSQTVENHVDMKISERIKMAKGNLKETQNQQWQAYKQAERQAKENADFNERLKVNMERANQEKQARKQNPTIKNFPTHRGTNGKQYFNYDGVNMQTGEILRIRNLDKVCKDANGRYLYTGYIQTTPHEYDVEFVGTNAGMGMSPVCFTIDKRVSDLVQENNPVEIKNFLNLLSQEENFKGKDGEMRYIGSLDRAGNISKNENSQSLLGRIQRIQEEYSQSYERGEVREFE